MDEGAGGAPAQRRDQPRYLARTTGYTTNPGHALPGEPEALSAMALEEVVLLTARRNRDRQLREWRDARANVEREIDRLYAMKLGRDITTQLRSLMRTLDRIDRRLQRL